ncbi:NifU family protein [Candidatus Tachikawaea gelatinosa]|uniref:Fe/S biogenesis protein NfuA n=1 Tax=Candidatus Tachikawaea gelatinosa TaxID=1410383 RepID=A0A090ALM9_9ENTR|nr:NifU family protein [Candidatus Tachikawaea gelatinosa]BAP58554.1 Fe/S biogenesis protein NfuA [Candidatus Tachikawaea gelatinosa]
MITITKNAQEYLFNLLLKKEKGTQIRVFVFNPGSENAECGISYCPPKKIKITDYVLRFKKFFVYIDQESLPYLKKSKINIIEDQLSSTLTLDAPYAKILQYPRNSTLKEKIQYFIQLKINPKLESHGGSINLIDIKNNYAILEFKGGCSGCSMAEITFKENIEKQLKKEFKELQGVLDKTEHIHGKHSYY